MNPSRDLGGKQLSDKYRAAFESYMTGLAMFRSSIHGMSVTEQKAHESAFLHGWYAREDAGLSSE